MSALLPPPPPERTRELVELPLELLCLILQHAAPLAPGLTLYNADLPGLMHHPHRQASAVIAYAQWVQCLRSVCRRFGAAPFAAPRVVLVNPARSSTATDSELHVPRPEHAVTAGTNTWIPEDISLHPTKPVTVWYEVRADSHNSEVIGAFSQTLTRWTDGQGGEDALTWYAAPHRHDFTFRVRMFDFHDDMMLDDLNNPLGVPSASTRTPYRLRHGVWHLVCVRLSQSHAAYSIDGHDIDKCYLEPNVSMASRGRIGMVTYDTSYTWRNLHIVLPDLEQELGRGPCDGHTGNM